MHEVFKGEPLYLHTSVKDSVLLKTALGTTPLGKQSIDTVVSRSASSLYARQTHVEQVAVLVFGVLI